jgi:hypothetical protein
MLRIYMLCHDDASEQRAHSYAQRYDWIRVLRLPNTKWMESAVFRLLSDPTYVNDWDSDAIEYVGILKYNFQEKSPFYDFPTLCRTTATDWDVWTFVNGHEDTPLAPAALPMVSYAGVCHTLFPILWYFLFHTHVPLEHLFSPTVSAFYSNAWIAKKHYFKSFVSFANDARHRMETEEPLKTLLHYNANYLQRLPTPRLMELMEAPYYTYHCFLMERVPCLYFWLANARIFQVGGTHRRLATDPDPSIPCLI